MIEIEKRPEPVTFRPPEDPRRWVLVANTIAERIADGRYPNGGWVPPKPWLCRELSVSRVVVEQALDAVHKAGLITHVPGIGYYVGTGKRPCGSPQQMRHKTVGVTDERLAEVWVGRRVHATLAEATVVRYQRPNGTMVRVSELVLDLSKPGGTVELVEVHGIAEDDGTARVSTFCPCAHEVPVEIAALIPVLQDAEQYFP